MSRLKEIHDYLIKVGKAKEDFKKLDKNSICLSMEIMEYAHRNQKRENGENYANHPIRCMQNYRYLLGLDSNDCSNIDINTLDKCEIPYYGVQEVCLLHDVIEDGHFSLIELEEIFDECDLGDFFRLYIMEPLFHITRDKNMDYEPYIKVCMENPISSICKMMDLQDNMNILSLTNFKEKNYNRMQEYIKYFYYLNSKYEFIERAQLYKRRTINEKKNYHFI